MKVMKFGGTSVQDASAILRLIQITKNQQGPALVVVSALSKVTDQLLQICELTENQNSTGALELLETLSVRHQTVASDLNISKGSCDSIQTSFHRLAVLIKAMAELGEVSLKSKDLVVSHGEIWSSLLVHAAVQQVTPSAFWADSRTLIKTNSVFGAAAVNWPQTHEQIQSKLLPQLQKSFIGVTQGFIGADSYSATTTLGRGGSDYSGAIYGACLNASVVEIWTDVTGIMTTDPRVVPGARTIQELDYHEAAEMAYFGAKVLHPATIFPAVEKNIPVMILNSLKPSEAGTRISGQSPIRSGIQGIAFKQNVTLVNIHSTRMLGAHGFLKSVFDLFAEYRLSVDLISTSEVSLSLTLDPSHKPGDLDQLTEKLSAFATVEISGGNATVSLVGKGIRSTAGLGARIFDEIKDFNVRMISMGASELNLSLVVSQKDLIPIAVRLHKLCAAQSPSNN